MKKLNVGRFLLIGFVLVAISSCGYTQKVQLPDGIETIYVPNFKNEIPQGDRYSYEAGLEIDVTNGVIDELIFDGNLRVVTEEKADAVLEGAIIGYQQEALRYNEIEGVSEYRLFLVTRLVLRKVDTGEILWQENHFTGDTSFFIEGTNAVSERYAADEAIKDLAKKIVSRIVEDW
jgi:hypothetical protein